MTKAEELFHKIAEGLPEAKESKMFGAMCIKAANGKAAAMFKDNNMIFKLDGEAEKSALKLEGAHIFDPMGGKPMTGWVQLSEAHSGKWKKYAEIAMDKVKMIEVTKKEKKVKS